MSKPSAKMMTTESASTTRVNRVTVAPSSASVTFMGVLLCTAIFLPNNAIAMRIEPVSRSGSCCI